MKKIFVLMLIGLLAACESSALIQEEEAVLEPVVVEVTPVEVLPEVVEEVIEHFNLNHSNPYE
jgi:glycerol-3-phosphate responsive antiterminator